MCNGDIRIISPGMGEMDYGYLCLLFNIDILVDIPTYSFGIID